MVNCMMAKISMLTRTRGRYARASCRSVGSRRHLTRFVVGIPTQTGNSAIHSAAKHCAPGLAGLYVQHLKYPKINGRNKARRSARLPCQYCRAVRAAVSPPFRCAVEDPYQTPAVTYILRSCGRRLSTLPCSRCATGGGFGPGRTRANEPACRSSSASALTRSQQTSEARATHTQRAKPGPRFACGSASDLPFHLLQHRLCEMPGRHHAARALAVAPLYRRGHGALAAAPRARCRWPRRIFRFYAA